MTRKRKIIPKKWRHLRPQTIAVLASRNFHDWRKTPFNAIAPYEKGLTGPICTSIAFGFTEAEMAADIFEGVKEGYAYPRISCGTPPIHQLAQRLLELELGPHHPQKEQYDVLLTGSGMSAIACTILTLADRGRAFLSPHYLYGGTHHLFTEYFPGLGIKCLIVENPLNLEEWERKLVNTSTKKPISLLYAEDDANPTPFKLDNKALAKLAHEYGKLYICDRTIGTPILEKPLLSGTDLVIHSLSKNISGYSWALGGAVIGKKELVHKIRDGYFAVIGPILDPRAADHILYGLANLEKRMAIKTVNAQKVCQFLRQHPRVATVFGPGGDLLAFEIKGSLKNARQVVEAYKLIIFAPHLGDIQTLSIHPASTTHAKVPKKIREQIGITDGLIRLSVGLENPLDIIDDLDQALLTGFANTPT